MIRDEAFRAKEEDEIMLCASPINEDKLPEIKFENDSFLLINRVKTFISVCFIAGYTSTFIIF